MRIRTPLLFGDKSNLKHDFRKEHFRASPNQIKSICQSNTNLLIKIAAVRVAHVVRVQHRALVVVGIYCASKWSSGVVAVRLLVVVPGIVVIPAVIIVLSVVVILAVIIIRRQEHVPGCSHGLLVVAGADFLGESNCCQTTDDNNDFVQLQGQNIDRELFPLC